MEVRMTDNVIEVDFKRKKKLPTWEEPRQIGYEEAINITTETQKDIKDISAELWDDITPEEELHCLKRYIEELEQENKTLRSHFMWSMYD
jgi:hypothetical protein